MYRSKRIKLLHIPIAVDFDGVIHGYRKGFFDGTIYDKPVSGVRQAMKLLKKNYFLFKPHKGYNELKRILNHGL